ncbi:MAG TPA: tyrosine-type recombinase/integrase [Terriglobia bacterium]|nr:tyrosine-type recombinase/integrase [Terriglobia bacterium]
MRLGRFNTAKGRERRVDCLTQEEATRFLDATRTHRSERYPFFLTALRSGLRLGELLALEWDDIQFGTSEAGQSRYIIVRHNFVRGRATTPKNRKLRRVDLSRELRSVLMELRDRRTLEAIEKGKFDEQDSLPFPSWCFRHAPART